MRICLASRFLSRAATSGLANATAELARALAAQGHSVHVLTRSVDAPTIDGVDVRWIAAPTAPAHPVASAELLDALGHAAAVHRAVESIHEDHGIDAVMAPLWGGEGAVCILDERFPTLVSCMTSRATIHALGEGTELSRADEQLVAFERAALRRTAHLHALTRADLDRTVADSGAKPDVARVIGRGLADRAGVPDPAGAGGPLQVLFVGRLEHRKGVDTLLAAASELAAEGVDFALDVVGAESPNAAYRSSFESSAARDPAFARRVRFAGVVDDAELDRLFRAADVVCVPSRYESHGVVLVEAMMFGKPIVACGIGGVPEVVEDEGNALLVPPDRPDLVAAALRRLADQPGLRSALARRSRELYETRFDSAIVADRVAAFLREVAERPRATTDASLPARLAELVDEVLALGPDGAASLARDVVSPPADGWQDALEEVERDRLAWRIRAHAAEDDRAAWEDRAQEAERQREELQGVLDSVARSRSWRLTRPLRRARQLSGRPEPSDRNGRPTPNAGAPARDDR
jgi:glycosyltransferase involved in cell wall biosynthesis